MRTSGSAASSAGISSSARSRIADSIFIAKGREARIAEWARRMRAAATIFIALVICWVDRTDLILRRISRREAIGYFVSAGSLDFEGARAGLRPPR